MSFLNEKFNFSKIKPKWLIAAGFIGIGLIFLSSFFPSDKKGGKTDLSSEQSLSEYEKELEQKTSKLVEKISGAGKLMTSPNRLR